MTDKIRELVEEIGIDEKHARALVEGIETLVETRAAEMASKKIEEAREEFEEKLSVIEEHKNEEITEEVNNRIELMVESIERTIDLAFNEWREEQEEKLSSLAMVESARKVLEGAREIKLLESNDSISRKIARKIEEENDLRKLYKELLEDYTALKKEILEYQKAVEVMKATKGLSEAKMSKVVEMASLLETSNMESFKKAVETIVEEITGVSHDEFEDEDIDFQLDEEGINEEKSQPKAVVTSLFG